MPETMSHLTLACPFSRQIWYETLAWLRLPCQPPDGNATLVDWWRGADKTLPQPMHKGLASIALLTPWMIWKHRNACVFNHARPSVSGLMTKIKEEAALWAQAGAKGLRSQRPGMYIDVFFSFCRVEPRRRFVKLQSIFSMQ